MKTTLTLLAVLTITTFFSQNVGINQNTPTNSLHISPILNGDNPIRIDGLQSYTIGDTSLLILNPANGVVKYIATNDFINIINNSGNVGTDNQNIDSITLAGNNLTIYIENGTSAVVDLSSLQDADSDPTNEIELPSTAVTNQVLTWDGTNWVAQNAGAGADNWGNQVVQVSGTNISGNGTTASPLAVTDNDSDPTNEIELPTGGTNGQLLSTNGSGTYTWVSDNSGTDNQNIANLSFNNSTNILTIGIENGTSQTVDLSNLVNDADNNITNEIQDLSINTSTNILTITNNSLATNINLSSYLDNTDAQTLSLTGNTLSISNGNNVTLTDNVNDADSNPSNEIQNLSVGSGSSTSSIININGGSGVTIQVSGDLTITETGNVITIGGGTPAGAVMAFNLATCPTGWAPANGTGGMPDLRGEFVRGLDNGRGVDAGRILASSQIESLKSHNHSVNPPATNSNTTGNHLHSIDPPATNSNSTGNHSHSVNPPYTATSTNGNHRHLPQNGNAFLSSGSQVGNNGTGNAYGTNAATWGGVGQSYRTSYDGNHNHGVDIAAFNSASSGNHSHNTNIAPFNSNTTGNHSHSVDISAFNSANTGASETKPRNVALLYCVKQ